MALDLPKREKIEVQEPDRELLYSPAEAKRLILSGANSFGVHGASLTWGVNGVKGGVVGVGHEGEKMVGKFLDQYANEHQGVRVLHSIEWPGSKGDTDHMLIVGNLMVIIDAKRWKAKRKYSVTPRGAILRGTVAFPEGKVKMLPAMKAWRETMGKGVSLVGIVCVAQHEVFVPYDKNWKQAPFKLVTIEQLGVFLDKLIASHPKAKESTNSRTLMIPVSRVIKPFDPRAGLIS